MRNNLKILFRFPMSLALQVYRFINFKIIIYFSNHFIVIFYYLKSGTFLKTNLMLGAFFT